MSLNVTLLPLAYRNSPNRSSWRRSRSKSPSSRPVQMRLGVPPPPPPEVVTDSRSTPADVGQRERSSRTAASPRTRTKSRRSPLKPETRSYVPTPKPVSAFQFNAGRGRDVERSAANPELIPQRTEIEVQRPAVQDQAAQRQRSGQCPASPA